VKKINLEMKETKHPKKLKPEILLRSIKLVMMSLAKQTSTIRKKPLRKKKTLKSYPIF
jgi:hypothetical protein